jgi:glycosyltransferase involved in cell wall biosynthesis
MKVLIAASLASSLINFRGELIRSLLEEGVEVHASAPDFDADTAACEALSAWGVTVHRLVMQRTGMNPFVDLRSALAFVRLMRRVRPHIFVGYTAKPVIYGLMGARLAGVPKRIALITGLGYGFQGGTRRYFFRFIMRLLYRRAMRGATVVVFQNPDDLQTFLDLKLIGPGVMTEVVDGSGVDMARFSPQPIPTGPTTFLMIARLVGDKGVREYVQGAELVRQDFPEARFILVGPRDSNPDAISAAEIDRWVSKGTIDYRGAQMDVRPVLSECSVYVLPSYREGTPRSVLEAMATGRPVITTDAPGCRQTVDDEVNGFLVPARSSEAVALAMRKFLHDRSLVPRMAEASLAKVTRTFDVRLVNQQMLRIMGLR